MLFITISASLYWYDRFNKTVEHSLAKQTLDKDVKKNIDKLFENDNLFAQWQTQVADVLNANIQNGRLVVPKK